MIRCFFTVIVFTTIFSFKTAFAHGDSGHAHGPIDENRAMLIADGAASQFVEIDAGLGFGKLTASWKDLPAEAINIHVKGKGYYIVSVKNKPENKTLYVLIAADGGVYDANFTGDFPKLKQ